MSITIRTKAKKEITFTKLYAAAQKDKLTGRLPPNWQEKTVISVTLDLSPSDTQEKENTILFNKKVLGRSSGRLNILEAYEFDTQIPSADFDRLFRISMTDKQIFSGLIPVLEKMINSHIEFMAKVQNPRPGLSHTLKLWTEMLDEIKAQLEVAE